MKRISLFAGLALMAIGTQANASLLTVESLAPGKYGTVNISFNNQNLYVYAGALQTKLDGGAAFDAYCVDLTHFDYLPANYEVSIGTTQSLTNGDRIGKIYNTYAPLVNSGDAGEALQLAIWDVLVDGGDGLDNGNFKASGYSNDALSQFNTILSNPLSGANPTASYYEAANHDGGLNQNLIGPYQGAAPVPEPASMAVLGLGALGALRRRKNRTA
jgi:PEP-CTERM motif